MRIFCAALASIALLQSAAYLVRTGLPKQDGIGPILDAYRSVAPLLPPHGVVGFVDTAPDAEFNAINYYLAQQALAPRVVSLEIGTGAAVVITTTGAPDSVMDLPALKDFRLTGTGAGFIRVLRKEQR
jgi:hypothetical protein